MLFPNALFNALSNALLPNALQCSLPDSQLADELGVTRQAVAQARKRLGITAFSKRPEF